MRETKKIELKETITNTFLKTVSAFANYEGGEIYFGIDDNGNIKALHNTKQACLDIENKINDSISPQPDYILETQNNEQTIKLTVKSGIQKPYLYKSKAYKRNDTATIEVDTLEFSRLVLEGKNIDFEELPAKEQNLSFDTLKQELEEKINITNFDKNILITLNLYNNANGYNNAAALLADRNTFPGIDIAKFGENINIIQKRAIFNNISILTAFKNAIEIYKDYYQYEEIQGSYRKTVEKIPEEAFREALANALIHRMWDTKAQIRVLMFDDYLEIISPGGLPSGITEEEYSSGRISVLRNIILAGVFFRLGIVETFATGIKKIRRLYQGNTRQPVFKITPNTISVTLPIFEENLNLTDDEKEIYHALSKTKLKSISEILPDISFSRTKAIKLLKELAQKELIKVIGEGRGTKYLLK